MLHSDRREFSSFERIYTVKRTKEEGTTTREFYENNIILIFSYEDAYRMNFYSESIMYSLGGFTGLQYYTCNVCVCVDMRNGN